MTVYRVTLTRCLLSEKVKQTAVSAHTVTIKLFVFLLAMNMTAREYVLTAMKKNDIIDGI